MFQYSHRLGRPFLWAHRGASALAPENTIAAFLAAEAHGANGIECDLRLSKDGVIVVHHNPYLDEQRPSVRFVPATDTLEAALPVQAVADGAVAVAMDVNRQGVSVTVRGWTGVHQSRRRRIAELTWDEVTAGSMPAAGEASERIPRLEEVLEALAPTTALDLELKEGPGADLELVRRVMEMIRHYRAEERVLLCSFDHHTLRQVALAHPEIALCAIYHGRLVQPKAALDAIPARHVDLNAGLLTEDDVHALQQEDIAVSIGEIHDLDQLQTVVGWAPDAVFLDDPRWMQSIRPQEQPD